MKKYLDKLAALVVFLLIITIDSYSVKTLIVITLVAAGFYWADKVRNKPIKSDNPIGDKLAKEMGLTFGDRDGV